jgi:hypothetical protein
MWTPFVTSAFLLCGLLQTLRNSVSICLKWSGQDLPPWSRFLLQKLTVAQMINKFPWFYGTWKFTALFSRPRLCIQFTARVTHFTPPYRNSLKPVRILYSYFVWDCGLSFWVSGLVLYAFLTPPCMPRPVPWYILLLKLKHPQSVIISYSKRMISKSYYVRSAVVLRTARRDLCWKLLFRMFTQPFSQQNSGEAGLKDGILCFLNVCNERYCYIQVFLVETPSSQKHWSSAKTDRLMALLDASRLTKSRCQFRQFSVSLLCVPVCRNKYPVYNNNSFCVCNGSFAQTYR